MAANGWRYGTDLEQLLAEQPHSVEFYQAVRLIEALRTGFVPVGTRGAEPVRFESSPDLGFHATDVLGLTPGDDGEPHRMVISFLGLAGASGPLPQPFAELLLERTRKRDRAMKAFLDIFNHRLVALLYRAHKAIRPGFEDVAPAAGRHANHLFSLMGLGMPSARNRLGVADAALLPHAGMFAQQPRSAVALERTLATMFAAPVRLRPFVGHWHRLAPSARTRLGGLRGQNAVLGRSAVLGTRAWIQDGRVEIVLGPLPRSRFESFLPPFAAHRALASVARLGLGPSLDVRLRLRLTGAEMPPLRLSRPTGGHPGPRLGWTTWLGGKPRLNDDDQVVVRLGSGT